MEVIGRIDGRGGRKSGRGGRRRRGDVRRGGDECSVRKGGERRSHS